MTGSVFKKKTLDTALFGSFMISVMALKMSRVPAELCKSSWETPGDLVFSRRPEGGCARASPTQAHPQRRPAVPEPDSPQCWQRG